MQCSGESSSSDGGTDSGEQQQVAIVTPYLSSVTTKQMVDVLEASAKEKGWKTNIVDTNGDVGALASRMEDVISSNVDAIVLVVQIQIKYNPKSNKRVKKEFSYLVVTLVILKE